MARVDWVENERLERAVWLFQKEKKSSWLIIVSGFVVFPKYLQDNIWVREYAGSETENITAISKS